MCQILTSVDWLGLLQTVAAVGMFFIALAALNTWKLQAKAQKQTDFLDELTDKVHEYIQSLITPSQQAEFVKIGFQSYINTPTATDDSPEAGAIAYIVQNGEADGQRLLANMEIAKEVLAKIQALVAKGTVYGFKDYGACQSAVTSFTYEYGRIIALGSFIQSKNWNWDNAKVRELLQQFLALDIDETRQRLNDCHAKFMGFVNTNYQEIYRGT